jgi:hypothetical protein
MSKEIKYVQIRFGDRVIEQILGESIKNRPRGLETEYVTKIYWENSDLIIETDKCSIYSYNERYVISWGIF